MFRVYPNPVRRGVTVRFEGVPARVQLRIYNVGGEELTGAAVQQPGDGPAVWRVPPDAAQGAYVCVLRCGARTCGAEVVVVLP